MFFQRLLIVYVGVNSALVEVSRLVINWPSLTEATLASRQKDSSF